MTQQTISLECKKCTLPIDRYTAYKYNGLCWQCAMEWKKEVMRNEGDDKMVKHIETYKPSKNYVKWEEWEVDFLRGNPNMPLSEAAQKLGRSANAVNIKKGREHIFADPKWTPEMENKLIEYRKQGLKYREIAPLLNKTIRACSSRMNQLAVDFLSNETMGMVKVPYHLSIEPTVNALFEEHEEIDSSMLADELNVPVQKVGNALSTLASKRGYYVNKGPFGISRMYRRTKPQKGAVKVEAKTRPYVPIPQMRKRKTEIVDKMREKEWFYASEVEDELNIKGQVIKILDELVGQGYLTVRRHSEGRKSKQFRVIPQPLTKTYPKIPEIITNPLDDLPTFDTYQPKATSMNNKIAKKAKHNTKPKPEGRWQRLKKWVNGE